MNHFLKIICTFILIVLFILAFSSSYSNLSIDNLAYVLAIAVDASDTNNLEVSFQFSNTLPAESSSSEQADTFVNTVTASSLSNAINLINGYLGKQLNLSHCKVIIFSEELANQGISDEIYTLINDTQVRPSSNIIISKCSAKDYLDETNPELENLISKYYETFTNSSKYTGYIPDATIGAFFNSLICTTCEPYAILGDVSSSSIEGENNTKNVGVAVFKKDQLVGELDTIETIAFLSIRNKLDRFLVSIPDPLDQNNYIDIYLTPAHSSTVEVDTSSPSPFIKLNFSFSGRIYSMSENSDYLSSEVLEQISNSCNSYLENVFSEYLYKSSKDLKSDINGFGRSALQNFFTTKEFEDYNWTENYKDAFFDVIVDTSVKSGMLINEL
jgi:spore germination protein KC